jgi:DNA-binding LytR/AlgR family response regulator
MKIPALKFESDGSSSLVLLDVNDVVYICVENRNLVYHTQNESFQHISTLSDWEEHLYNYGFDMLDKTNLVNINKIKKLDSKTGKVYFEEEPTKDSKYANIAFIKQKLFKSQIERAIAKNTNKSMEYKLEEERGSYKTAGQQELQTK